MAESPATESLMQRLAVGRLARAGVVDRESLQRTHDRFARSPRTSALDRLHRRIEPATPSSGSLPLVRIDRSNDRAGSGSVATDSTTSMTPTTSAPAGTVAESAASDQRARFVAAERAARQAPSISRTGAFVARRTASTPGLIAAGSTTSGILNVQSSHDAAVAHARVVAGAAPTAALHRTAERKSEPAASSVGLPAPAVTPLALASSAGSTPMIMRSASPSLGAATASPASPPNVASTASPAAPSIVDRGVSESLAMSGAGGSSSKRTSISGSLSARTVEQTAPSAAASIGELPRVSAGMTARAISPIIWRKSDPTSPPIPTVPALAATTSSPTIVAAPTQLVLRKAMVSPIASQSHVQLPSITPSAPQMVARTADESHRHAHANTSTSSHDWNIDWITEQVGRRLARRLEIERERMGARSWR